MQHIRLPELFPDGRAPVISTDFPHLSSALLVLANKQYPVQKFLDRIPLQDGRAGTWCSDSARDWTVQGSNPGVD